jgi:hypothetical protein
LEETRGSPARLAMAKKPRSTPPVKKLQDAPVTRASAEAATDDGDGGRVLEPLEHLSGVGPRAFAISLPRKKPFRPCCGSCRSERLVHRVRPVPNQHRAVTLCADCFVEWDGSEVQK